MTPQSEYMVRALEANVREAVALLDAISVGGMLARPAPAHQRPGGQGIARGLLERRAAGGVTPSVRHSSSTAWSNPWMPVSVVAVTTGLASTCAVFEQP